VRPQPEQIERARTIDGQVPMVSPDAPFRGLSFQLLTPGVAYGTLRFVPAEALESTALGPRDIVVTDRVPNDIPLVAGLVTEAFQTPLSHVNILSRGRGTPNLALADAREDERLAPYFDRLVRFEVTGSDFTIAEADPEEALEFWQSRLPSGPPLVPRLDTSVRGVQPLSERSVADIPSIGGKAAQFAELYRVPLCTGATVPPSAFAVPVVHSIEHFAASGAAERLAALRADPSFEADPLVRGAGLAEIRELIETHPVDPDLLAEVTQAIADRFPGVRVRFRSSSNVEDLGGFNGAGLYDSTGVDPDELDDGIEDAIRKIWASLWNLRAYDERAYYHIDQTALGMAVLVHPAYPSERANGVAISRNIFAPSEGYKYYINAQIGEALVTNPAPGVTSDQIVYAPGRPSDLVYQSRSSLTGGAPVLTETEIADISCSLYAIHNHYRALLDPAGENTWFAMDIEFKLLGPSRQLLIKQARPYSFGTEPPSDWCDF
ncbi:MAG TPA: PEP/pyruvate-binding domain-containing protein, partial [Polyangiaceae bacterium]|nr:PEP/pyruvate-binding domain-containing protein [Polyangiaceae bacterium]